jgi:hypothetical protein
VVVVVVVVVVVQRVAAPEQPAGLAARCSCS